MDLPQAKRAKMMERQAEEAKRAREAREREEGRSAAERAERLRQIAMNKLAYDECFGLWEALRTAEPSSLGDPGRAIAKRVSHRAELKLVVTPSPDVKRMPPGSFVAMGTSGLQPTELRAVLHALTVAGPTGGAAQGFIAMLTSKLPELPDFEPSADLDALVEGVVAAVAPVVELSSASQATQPPPVAPPPVAPPPMAPPPIAPPPMAPPPVPPPPPAFGRAASAAGMPGADPQAELLAAIKGGARLRSASSAQSVSPPAPSGSGGGMSSVFDELTRKASERQSRVEAAREP